MRLNVNMLAAFKALASCRGVNTRATPEQKIPENFKQHPRAERKDFALSESYNKNLASVSHSRDVHAKNRPHVKSSA